MITKIYALCNPSGKIRYIGKTIKPLGDRLYLHLYGAKSGTKNHRYDWIRSLLTRGYLPTIQLIGEVEGDGVREEIAWIKYFRDEGLDLVNATDGGEGTAGRVCSLETRAKMSAAQKGSLSHMFGKHLAPETCAKMSANRKGTQHPMFGKRHSIASLAKMSAAQKGKRGYWLGKHLSPETCTKLSVAQRGKHPSPETRLKLSLALIKNRRAAKNN